VTAATLTGSATEIADNAAGENATTHTATGSIAFADVDLADSHAASVAPNAAGYLGTLTLGAVNQGANTVGWTFSVADSELDFLDDLAVLTQSYTVTLDDGNGGTVTQTITITLNGTADAPVVTSGVQAGGVVERADGADGENTAVLSSTGTVAFADVDLAGRMRAAISARLLRCWATPRPATAPARRCGPSR
jgi:VCBS repeat-containing protein